MIKVYRHSNSRIVNSVPPFVALYIEDEKKAILRVPSRNYTVEIRESEKPLMVGDFFVLI